MLDTIRQLTRTLKLKDLIISNFIPPDFSKGIEKRASWQDDEDCWVIQKMDLAGNNQRSVKGRPKSSGKLRRPESEYSRQRKQYDSNPRYRVENVTALELDMPEKTTQDFDGPTMASRVDPVLGMSINDDDGDDIEFASDAISSPYLQYNSESGGGGEMTSKAERRSSKSKSRRPSSAVNRRDVGDVEESKSSGGSRRNRK